MVAHLPSIAGLAVGGLLLAELVHPAPGSAHQTLLSLALVLLAGLALLRAAIAQRDAELEAAARASQDERVRQGRRMEAMGELAAAVSHDFANILTALGGAAEELRERQPEAPEAEEIAGLVQRGSELCRGLTAFARRSAPRWARRTSARWPTPWCRCSGASCRPASRWRWRAPRGPRRRWPTRAEIEVALINLVVNARDAMPRGGAVTISVDAAEPAEPDRAGRSGGDQRRRWARLTVADTGAGMDPETLARCTEPFFTTKPPGRGTGLGLATVNGIALAAGGRLEITSAPGAGMPRDAPPAGGRGGRGGRGRGDGRPAWARCPCGADRPTGASRRGSGRQEASSRRLPGGSMSRFTMLAVALLSPPPSPSPRTLRPLTRRPMAAPPNPMAAWKPKKVAREAQDKKEILALLKAMEQAGMKGDLAAAAATIDFPVLMVTDDAKGQASADSWSREQWAKVMAPMYEKPMEGKITHKPDIFLASDSLATLNDVVTMTMGKKTITARNTTILVRKNGQWLVKAMMEGGWGDMMAGPPPEAAAASRRSRPGRRGR